MADNTRLRDRLTRDRLLLAAVLVVGIAGTGIVRRQLGVLGYNGLGRLVFIAGYGLTVFLVWYGWIRPLDITGPGASRGVDRDSDERGPGEGDRPNGGEGGDGADAADDGATADAAREDATDR
ncbi:hypothetical protein [Halobaculum litoreum]|uniref:Uncharacterized protein n=1 Tax=Halobaculum litoreum TaxID=3031998 RepID=A0ABD5XN57_9EURY|nr:hypothetical protein [Halobaculum sp. DT92]